MNPASSADARVSLRTRFRTATREAILEAAAELLGADGAAATRMEDIAAKAGVAVGTVYNHFEDRAALVSALLETRTRSLLEQLDTVVTPAQKPRAAVLGHARQDPAGLFAQELRQFVSILARHVDMNRFLLTVLHDEERQRGIDARSATRRRTMLEELLARAGQLMDKGLRTRVLRREPAALYAAMLVGMMRGVWLGALTDRHAPADACTEAIVRLFMSGAAR
ncbi:MAG: helix-turn-helix domain-containing protein [Vicinamibacterales bacterium]